MTQEDFGNMSPDLKETFIKNYFENMLFYYSFNNNCLFKYLLIYHDILKILFSFFLGMKSSSSSNSSNEMHQVSFLSRGVDGATNALSICKYKVR